ncbi:Bestrophin, RFP-TM, chloride channel-domain-containing protein [Rhizophagus diaphanus]|nr:Bestrophin, RFP-TM, chloride channel-domain-containing protein [Rhizophagus diaphanus] [Rhizophagus sp. MUCL 43196]
MPVDANFKNPNAKGRFCSGLCRRRGWGYPDVLRVRGSVLPTTIPVLFFTALFTTQVVVLYKIFDIDVRMPESLVGTVAVVVGLLLAFRTNNAYDRYYEGRKLFVSMCTDIRNATRNIWVGVREVDEGDRQEKERNVKLLLAFAIAVKHHLRLEFGIDWYDLNDLLPEGLQLTNFDGNVAQENTVLGSGSEEDPNRHDANRPSTDLPDVRSSLRSIATRIPPTTYNTLRNNYSTDNTTIWFGASEWGNEVDASMSLPLEIIFHVGLYIDKKRGNIMDSAYGTISSNLNSLVDIFGNLERIGNTPIPFAYNIHLKQAVIIYVWILPFTLVAMLGWVTIPTVVLVGFILFGVESIGAEIENPFGYDTNDLPLDGYCQDLEAEIKYLERHIPSVKAVPASQSSR